MDLTRAKEEIYRSVGLNKLTEGNLKEYRELPETGVTYGTEKGGLKEVGNLQDIRRRIQ